MSDEEIIRQIREARLQRDRELELERLREWLAEEASDYFYDYARITLKTKVYHIDEVIRDKEDC